MRSFKGSKGKTPGFKMLQQKEEAVSSTLSTRGGGEKNSDRTANGKLPLGRKYILSTHLLIY
jgi:hypothetical protein